MHSDKKYDSDKIYDKTLLLIIESYLNIKSNIAESMTVKTYLILKNKVFYQYYILGV